MIKAVSTHTQTPINLASMICIGVISTASNKKFVIEPKRKSADYKTMTKSIYSYASELRNEIH